jgi:hypothetical protein
VRLELELELELRISVVCCAVPSEGCHRLLMFTHQLAMMTFIALLRTRNRNACFQQKIAFFVVGYDFSRRLFLKVLE